MLDNTHRISLKLFKSSKKIMSQNESYPDSLFKTWLDYRIDSVGQKRVDVINEINEKLDRNYNNSHYYKWLKLRMRAPDILMTEVIIPEMPSVIEWYFSRSGVNVKNLDLVDFTSKFKPPIKGDD